MISLTSGGDEHWLIFLEDESLKRNTQGLFSS